MTLRVEVETKLLAWAMERSGEGSVALHGRFTKLDSWLSRSVKPTLTDNGVDHLSDVFAVIK